MTRLEKFIASTNEHKLMICAAVLLVCFVTTAGMVRQHYREQAAIEAERVRNERDARRAEAVEHVADRAGATAENVVDKAGEAADAMLQRLPFMKKD